MLPRKALFALLPAILAVPGIRASAQAYVNENQGTYLYVDAQWGNDSSSGAYNTPLKTIQNAVNRANYNNTKWVGTKIIVRPGVYREHVSINNSNSTTAPLTIQASNWGTAIVTGSDVMSGWWWSWGQVWAHTWNYNFGTSAIPSGWPWNIAPIGRRTEMLFVNGVPLTQVMSTAQLIPGTFMVDEANNVMYMNPPAGTNVSSSSIEAAVRPQTLSVSSRSNVVLRGMVFQHAASSINTPGVSVSGSWNVLLDGDQANWNNWGGFGIYNSNNVTVQWSTANYNGGEGFTTTRGQHVLYDSNESDYNTWRGAQAGLYDWGMGGAKFMWMRYTTVQNHYAYRNQAQGVWFDTDNQHITVNNVTSSENTLGALQLELNEGPITVQNSRFCSSGIGANIVNSQYVTFNSNAFYNNGGKANQQAEIFLAGKSGGRGVSDWLTGTWYNIYTNHLTFNSNTFEDTYAAQNVFGTYLTGYDWTAFASSLTSNYNRWYNPGNQWAFKLPNNYYANFGGWKNSTNTDWTSGWALPTSSPAGPCWVASPSYTDFAVDLDKEVISMANGVATTGVHVKSYGYGNVSMWITGMPANSWAWLDKSGMVSGDTVLHFGASKTAAAQTVPVTLWAASGSRVHSITIYVSVTHS
jgi:hypothetical protein